MPTPELAAAADLGSWVGEGKGCCATTAAMLASESRASEAGETMAGTGSSGREGDGSCGDFWQSMARWKRQRANLKGA